MSLIVQNLYLGDSNDAFTPSFMYERPTVVLNCAKEISKSPYCTDYMHIALDDKWGEKLTPYLSSTNEFISRHIDAGNKVLVHCYAGVSRSASIVIGYIMYRYHLNFHDAYELVKAKRNVINPNFGFICQLCDYGYTLSANNRLTRA